MAEPESDRNRRCGQHPTLGHISIVRSCDRLLEIHDLYRCADCQTAFCRDCIRAHFRDEQPVNQEQMRKLENELAADPDDYEPGDEEE